VSGPRAIGSQLAYLLREAMRENVKGLHFGIPARVEAYTPGTATRAPTADVSPWLQEDDGTDWPVIQDCPIAYPRGGGFAGQWPLAAGDSVWLWFGERSLDQWLEYGGKRPPGGTRILDLADAVVWPGVGPLTDPTPPFGQDQPDDLVWGSIEANQTGGRFRVTDDHKLWIGRRKAYTGADVDLLHLIDDLLGALQVATCGGYPLDPATQAKLATIQAKLATIMEA